MKSEMDNSRYSKEVILTDVILILKEMIVDWDLEFEAAMGPDTKLIADLGFESIDVVQLVVAIEEHFRRRGLPWEEFLMQDGRYVDEIKIDDTAAFLHGCLNNYEKGAL
jgi:acyl carrier protein